MTNEDTMLLEKEIDNTLTLPTLPPGVSHLLQVLNQGDIHFSKLAKEIENFPNIAVKIIAISNSAWFTPISPISSLLEACSRLGLNTVRSISLALSITDVFDPSRCPEFDARYFWYTSLLYAEAANLCAEENSKVDIQSARTTGLLYNLGFLWLAYNRPQETGRAIIASQNENDVTTLTECLHKEIFTDHHITGGMLAQSMQLPDLLVNAITHTHEEQTESFSALDITMRNAHQLAEQTLTHESLLSENTDETTDNEKVIILLNRLENIKAIAEALFRASQ